jgi:tetratricopeptide (TPR) repeat protein
LNEVSAVAHRLPSRSVSRAGSASRSHFEQDETMEAFRAIRTAPLTFVALYLRHGDARGALASLDDDNVARVTAPHLRERLESVVSDNDAEAWAELFRLFESATAGDAGEIGIDRELARAAAWGAAIELFRAEPHSFRAAVPLCSLLLSHGMAEVAPLILEQALEHEEHPREASWATRYVLEAIHQAETLGDLPAARRTFEHSKTLIRLSEREVYGGRVTPSASRLHYFMGAIEAGAGELDRAHRLISLAVQREPTADALRMLASIDRQRKDYEPALASLERVIEITHRSGDSAAEAESQLLRFEVLRDMGNVERAAESLEAALMLGLSARTTAQSPSHMAVAERVLARVLEHYDERDAARRASKRAYEASRNDMQQLTETVLDSSRRALTLGDLRSARDSVRRAVSADLAPDDTVYAALWLQLLERRLKVSSDGTAEEALARLDGASGWVAKLAAWGRGRMSGQELAEGAGNRIQRIEAQFYRAMASPGEKQALERLREVATSEAIQLVEVTIARDLLAGRRKLPRPKLPPHVTLP